MDTVLCKWFYYHHYHYHYLGSHMVKNVLHYFFLPSVTNHLSEPKNACMSSYCLCACAWLESTQIHMIKNGGFISSVTLEMKHKYYDFFFAQATYKCTHQVHVDMHLVIVIVIIKGMVGWPYYYCVKCILNPSQICPDHILSSADKQEPSWQFYGRQKAW